ncbi:hypothetical protein LN042_10780 [Kitasatospora sp. RB6PN24]|uniref:hypothetical protein n=1 Tax=Kitasatospora humi TaxID=2893891 RepID=UPI001E4F6240|nr:hypothetical protein [Kitasatospora humi]MCC9307580.1 hypothetical protein [Kitasatospora humi]
MRTLSRVLGTVAAAGTMLLAATIPASAATPAQADYYGEAVASTAAGAKQAALSDAYALAAAAGFNSSQCLPLGVTQASLDNPYLSPRAARSAAAPQLPPPGSTWDGTAQVQCTTQPAPGTVNLNRYNGPEHMSTIGPIPAGYYLEGSLGWLYSSPQPGTIPLYMCKVLGTVDTFTSQASNCEGQQYLGQLGYINTAPPAGVASRVVRRCRVGSEHFDSNDINCEGQIAEGILGYSLD